MGSANIFAPPQYFPLPNGRGLCHVHSDLFLCKLAEHYMSLHMNFFFPAKSAGSYASWTMADEGFIRRGETGFHPVRVPRLCRVLGMSSPSPRASVCHHVIISLPLSDLTTRPPAAPKRCS